LRAPAFWISEQGERYILIAKVEKHLWTACSDGCKLAEGKDLNALPQSNVISVVVKRVCVNSATSSIYMFFFDRWLSSRLFSLTIMAMT